MVALDAMTLPRPRRRPFWISAGLLVLVLPLALAVHAGPRWETWHAERQRIPLPAEIGAAVRYGNGDWMLTRVVRLVPGDPERRIVVVEFEARPDTPAALVDATCAVRLVDAQGRSWQPTILPDPAIRRALPKASERSSCSGTTLAALPERGIAPMIASFSVPRTADGLRLEIGLSTARPAVLEFGGLTSPKS